MNFPCFRFSGCCIVVWLTGTRYAKILTPAWKNNVEFSWWVGRHFFLKQDLGLAPDKFDIDSEVTWLIVVQGIKWGMLVACAVVGKVIGFCFPGNNEAMKWVNLQVRREIHKYKHDTSTLRFFILIISRILLSRLLNELFLLKLDYPWRFIAKFYWQSFRVVEP